MTLRAALLLVSSALLAACVSTGQVDPMKTDKGRDAARDAYIDLGIGYLKQGATERAKVPLKKALEMDPSNADANAALALVFQTEMEPELADQHYRKALSSRSDSRILNNYGTFLFEQGRYKDAYERFQQATEDNLYPERSRVFENLGLTAMKMNNPALAKQHFDKALRLNRQQPMALLEMAQLSFSEKQYVPARDYYQRYSQIAPQTASSLLLGSRLATIFEDRDQAASLGLQLKRLYPGTPEYQQYLSEQ
ncbi:MULTISPECIES: type IV pilus biogenesis/stability protein PilW [Pseudomonas]|uniref:type IV pilus biogenesis/stability protein PilW n=1 Tax=Pseudomonadaceae TaxID=135621 RepID=UPI0003FB4713|nr:MULTISPECIES: type IV pilus biogenesis/stability protein PilW [Pseudomonas]MDE3736889.1 type IV pilus biogenesis/stability protein PilW [Pseudomonas resinovorans]MDH4584753.1 type IV pilus biogenesis/stability protein PilW [Pseudomonas sp. BN415]